MYPDWIARIEALRAEVDAHFATLERGSDEWQHAGSAIDALSASSPSVANWGDTFTTTTGFSYTVVPAPGALALLGLAGLGRRSRK